MRMFVILTVLLTMTVLTGCAESPLVSDDDSNFEIDYGQTVYVSEADVSLTFVGSVHDARCCMTCYCYWEGYAVITLKMKKGNDSGFVDLATISQTSSLSGEYVDMFGYRFELVGLSPYPQTGPYPNGEYTATVAVTTIPDDTVLSSVKIVNRPNSQIEIEQYNFDSASVVDEKIKLWVNHGGGCEPHYFQLYMSPDAFMGSSPQNVYLYLSHFGPPDLCEALIHRELEFDLSPIIDLYHSTVSGDGGQVQLNLVNCTNVQFPCDSYVLGQMVIPSLPD